MPSPRFRVVLAGPLLIGLFVFGCTSTARHDQRLARLASAKTDAMQACQEERDEACIERLEAVQHLAPDDAEVVHKLAWAYLSAKRLDDAIAAAKRTLELEPNEFRAYGLLGLIHRSRREYDEAISAYEMVLLMRPFDVTSLIALTSLHAKKRSWSMCIKYAIDADQSLWSESLEELPLDQQASLLRVWMFRSRCEAERDDPSPPRTEVASDGHAEAGGRDRIALAPRDFQGLTQEEQQGAHEVAVRLIENGRSSQTLGVQVLLGLARQGYNPAIADRGVLSMKPPLGAKSRSEAAGWFQMGARRGDPVSQVNLGALVWYRDESWANRAEAFRLFKLSADQGNPLAFFYVGVAYDTGVDGETDREEAVRWFTRAAEAGVPSGMGRLGMCLTEETGSADRQAEGIRWLREAALRGNRYGYFGLALAHLGGIGVVRDEAKAMELYRRAAAQGHGPASLALAVRFAAGVGTPKDMVRAWAYALSAEEAGHGSHDLRVALKRQSTPTQEREGRAIADRMRRNHPPRSPELDSYLLRPGPWQSDRP